MRDKRGWVPADWMDEVPPTQGEHPNDFLERRGDTIVLRPIGLLPGEIEGQDFPAAETLAAGQIVGFTWHEDRGSQSVTIRSAGDFSLAAPFPEDTNLFRVADPYYDEDIWDNLGDVVKRYIGEAECELPATIEVEGWVWSDTEWFKLTILESGEGRFEPHPSIGLEVAAKLIKAERQRQIEAEGFSNEHDDAHANGELLTAAICYLEAGWSWNKREDGTPKDWPWSPDWWKPKDERANAIRAGALCLAERERLHRRGDITGEAKVIEIYGRAWCELARMPA